MTDAVAPRVLFRLVSAPLDAALAVVLRDFGLGDGATLARQPNGKPIVLVDGAPASVGIGISHARSTEGPLVAIAMIDGYNVGLDIEPLDQAATDADFLTSVASPEDGDVLQRLARLGIDPGRALWCLKEAALKGSGEVMTDPRDLAVRNRKVLWRITPSHRASAPTPDFDAALFRLSGPQARIVLAAIALPADLGDVPTLLLNKFHDQFQSDVSGWRIAPLAGGLASPA